MSGKQVGKVYDHEFTATQQQIALALAEKAEHDGTEVHPSVMRLMWMTGLRRSTILATLSAFRRSGLLVPDRNQGGGRGKVPVYHFDWSKAKPKTPFPKWLETERNKERVQEIDPSVKGPDDSISSVKGPADAVKGPAASGPNSSFNSSSPSSLRSEGAQQVSDRIMEQLMERVRSSPFGDKATNLQIAGWKQEITSRIEKKQQTVTYVWALAEDVIAAARLGFKRSFKQAEERARKTGAEPERDLAAEEKLASEIRTAAPTISEKDMIQPDEDFDSYRERLLGKVASG